MYLVNRLDKEIMIRTLSNFLEISRTVKNYNQVWLTVIGPKIDINRKGLVPKKGLGKF